jgi:hypothetical protein
LRAVTLSPICRIGIRRRPKGVRRMPGISVSRLTVRSGRGRIRMERICRTAHGTPARPVRMGTLRTRTILHARGVVMRRRARMTLRAGRLRRKPQQERKREHRKHSALLHFQSSRKFCEPILVSPVADRDSAGPQVAPAGRQAMTPLEPPTTHQTCSAHRNFQARPNL